MSAPADWYPQFDGQLRYWDGELWTEHLAPGVPPVTMAVGGMDRHRLSLVAWVATLVMLVLAAASTAVTSGVGGALILLGLAALTLGGVASARGRIPTLRLASRRAGLVIAAGGLAVSMVGGAMTPTPAKTEAVGAPIDAPAASTPAETAASTAREPTPTVTSGPVIVPVPVRGATTPVAEPKRAAAGTALAAVALLTVKGRAPKTGYSRDQFGQSWFDSDRNGCDTRNDVLRRDLKDRQMKNACKVLAGSLAPDPYTSTLIRFVYGGASEVDIDHVVALSDAWQKGAARWPAGKRLAFANDPLNLLAVDASANRSKGDGDTATWLPANKPYRCTYVARQVAVKAKYGVWVTSAERVAMTRVLTTCPSMRLPGPGSAPTLAALPRTASPPAPGPAPPPQPAPAPQPAAPVQDVYYENCTAARAAGAAPIMRGEPGYASKLDRDNDGIACE